MTCFAMQNVPRIVLVKSGSSHLAQVVEQKSLQPVGHVVMPMASVAVQHFPAILEVPRTFRHQNVVFSLSTASP
jgi:hypothetical protein